MNQDLTKPDPIKKERDELQKIVKEVTIEMEEMKPIVEARTIELSKYYSVDEETGEVTFKVLSEEQRKECAVKIKESNFVINQGVELRKSVTRRLDTYKKKWMEIEYDIFDPLDRAKNYANDAADHFVKIETEKAEKEKARIQLEADKKEEAIQIESTLETNYHTGSTRELATIKSGIIRAWDSLTIADFDVRIKSLQGYKPKINVLAYNEWFAVKPELISVEEAKVLSDKVMNKFCFILFERWILDEVQKIKSELLEKKDEKLAQLKELAKKNEFEQAVEKERIIKANQEKLVKEQAEAENKISEAAEESLTSKKLVHNISTQAQIQNVKELEGGIRRVQSVMILPEGADWNEIIKHYSPKSDLDFLLKNLIKVGKPAIKGVKYYIDKKSSTVK